MAVNTELDWGNPFAISFHLVRPRCAGCGRRFYRKHNRRQSLRENYAAHGCELPAQWIDQNICPSCYNDLAVARCCLTGEAFPAAQNQYHRYVTEFRGDLSPDHGYGGLTGALSPAGLAKVQAQHANVMALLAHWSLGAKYETLPGFRIVRRLGPVRQENGLDSMAEVQAELKRRTAQRGGNGYICFYWEKKIHWSSETYVRGYGPRGNPWYGTRHIRHDTFTGQAEAVQAVPIV